METLTREEGSELLRRAHEMYDAKLRPIVNTPENLGKMIIFNIETGDYEIGDEMGIEANRKLQARNPGVELMGFRIGYRSVDTFGGVRRRENE